MSSKTESRRSTRGAEGPGERTYTAAGVSLSPGTTVSHYRIVSQVGAGGMGEVYLAEDTVLRRQVAIKFLPVAASEEAEKRLLREARAAAALDHANICSVYEVGQEGPHRFIVMQYVEGETLAARIERQPLTPTEVLDLTIRIADALGAAHEHGIVHRDVKPKNIMITGSGVVKVLDFGIARMSLPGEAEDESQLTASGAILGTTPYMAPEQVQGETVDARSDLFSLGAVIYELLTGKRLFTGPNLMATFSAILTRDPPPLAGDATVPAELERIMRKALVKDREKRYQSARLLQGDLERLQHKLAKPGDSTSEATATWQATASGTTGNADGRVGKVPRSRGRLLLVLVAVGIALTAAGVGLFLHQARVQRATELVTEIAELVKSEDYFAAYRLALEVRKYLPEEPTVAELWPYLTITLSVSTEPPRSRIYLQRFSPDESGNSPPRELIGTTPVHDLTIGRGDYLLTLEMEGYAPRERILSGALFRYGDSLPPSSSSPPIRVEETLHSATEVPPEMVWVPGDEYRLVGWGRPSDRTVALDDFLIDRFEVSNREYQEFIRAGGYRDPQYWRIPFVKEGEELSWDEAMREFSDLSGLPGPRGWSNQSFPSGTGDHPVTGITGYEAAAYAAFRDKELPTLFQWEKAARDGVTSLIGSVMPWGPASGTVDQRANCESQGTMPVTSFPFGMSPYGCYNMAGNAAEWCRAGSRGFVFTGGSWRVSPRLFAWVESRPRFSSSDAIGFRCVRNSPGAQGDQGGELPALKAEIPAMEPTSEASFNAWLSHYRYDPAPPDPRIEAVETTAEWRREKISFRAAGGERAIAYLYLPEHFEPPFPVIQFVPGGDIFMGDWPVWQAVEKGMTPYIRSGYAVFAVVLKGFKGRPRPSGWVRPDPRSVRFRELIVDEITDLRRGLDYLETRSDVDPSRLALLGVSTGASLGLIAIAVDRRYHSVVFLGFGFDQTETQRSPEVSPVNFAPHSAGPKLVLAGRYDETHPYSRGIEPLFKLLREPKRMVPYDGEHMPPFEFSVPVINAWLEETLGTPGTPAAAAIPD